MLQTVLRERGNPPGHDGARATPAECVYSTCRFSYEVHDPHGQPKGFAGSVGTLIGSRLQPFGTTAGGTDPTLRIAPGATDTRLRLPVPVPERQR